MATTDLISLEKDYEVRHWMRTFGCTETELFEAVRNVGLDAQSVKQYRACRGGFTITRRAPAAVH
jgi:Protein of unknown function (DUF3606)